MFYSQFILAKKGPLGTIWIAAHLERKLRKNQVADTDIGVSVDSILSPEVPIALRLSSHLLLGVVRIYSRKVNYLFHDCSEALLKVKQAFRSTAVDLPPEESTAPYHSITLPETFDLDDFELPDGDNFQGNFIDHHVSTREQITLQDSLDGVVYSTSQFGLDERFGDGDTSQALDLDEELFMDNVTANEGTRDLLDIDNVDHQASAQPMTPFMDMDMDMDMGVDIDDDDDDNQIMTHEDDDQAAIGEDRILDVMLSDTNSQFDKETHGLGNEISESKFEDVIMQDFTNNVQYESEYCDPKFVGQGTPEDLFNKQNIQVTDMNEAGDRSLLNNQSSEADVFDMPSNTQEKQQGGSPAMVDLNPNSVNNNQSSEIDVPQMAAETQERQQTSSPVMVDMNPNSFNNNQSSEIHVPLMPRDTQEKQQATSTAMLDLSPNSFNNNQNSEIDVPLMPRDKQENHQAHSPAVLDASPNSFNNHQSSKIDVPHFPGDTRENKTWGSPAVVDINPIPSDNNHSSVTIVSATPLDRHETHQGGSPAVVNMKPISFDINQSSEMDVSHMSHGTKGLQEGFPAGVDMNLISFDINQSSERQNSHMSQDTRGKQQEGFPAGVDMNLISFDINQSSERQNSHMSQDTQGKQHGDFPSVDMNITSFDINQSSEREVLYTPQDMQGKQGGFPSSMDMNLLSFDINQKSEREVSHVPQDTQEKQQEGFPSLVDMNLVSFDNNQNSEGEFSNMPHGTREKQQGGSSAVVDMNPISFDVGRKVSSPTSVLTEQLKPTSPAPGILERDSALPGITGRTEQLGDTYNVNHSSSDASHMYAEVVSTRGIIMDMTPISTLAVTSDKPIPSSESLSTNYRPINDCQIISGDTSQKVWVSHGTFGSNAHTKVGSEGNFPALSLPYGSNPPFGSVGAHGIGQDERRACLGPEAVAPQHLFGRNEESWESRHVIRPCSSFPKQPDTSSVARNSLNASDSSSRGGEPSSWGILGREENIHASGLGAMVQGEDYQPNYTRDTALKAKRISESVPLNGLEAYLSNTNSVISKDVQSGNFNWPAFSGVVPEPERLLSVPATAPIPSSNFQVLPAFRNEMSAERDMNGNGLTSLSGRKRQLMESPPVQHGGSSVEFFGMQSRKTVDSVPKDSDILSSILGERRSSVPQLRPTPQQSDIASKKRQKKTPRTSVAKRKVLLDDTMVLHGDTIRQQLTSTEDIRRIRKKAPCTRTEIWMIQKYLLEEEIFSEPLLTGMSPGLVNVHNRTYAVTDSRVSEMDEVHTLSEVPAKELLPTSTNLTGEANTEETREPVVVGNDSLVNTPKEIFTDIAHRLPEDRLINPIECDIQEQTRPVTGMFPFDSQNVQLDMAATGTVKGSGEGCGVADGMDHVDTIVSDSSLVTGLVSREKYNETAGSGIESLPADNRKGEESGLQYKGNSDIQSVENDLFIPERNSSREDDTSHAPKVNDDGRQIILQNDWISDMQSVERDTFSGMNSHRGDDVTDGAVTNDEGHRMILQHNGISDIQSVEKDVFITERNNQRANDDIHITINNGGYHTIVQNNGITNVHSVEKDVFITEKNSHNVDNALHAEPNNDEGCQTILQNNEISYIQSAEKDVVIGERNKHNRDDTNHLKIINDDPQTILQDNGISDIQSVEKDVLVAERNNHGRDTASDVAENNDEGHPTILQNNGISDIQPVEKDVFISERNSHGVDGAPSVAQNDKECLLLIDSVHMEKDGSIQEIPESSSANVILQNTPQHHQDDVFLLVNSAHMERDGSIQETPESSSVKVNTPQQHHVDVGCSSSVNVVLDDCLIENDRSGFPNISVPSIVCSDPTVVTNDSTNEKIRSELGHVNTSDNTKDEEGNLASKFTSIENPERDVIFPSKFDANTETVPSDEGGNSGSQEAALERAVHVENLGSPPVPLEETVDAETTLQGNASVLSCDLGNTLDEHDTEFLNFNDDGAIEEDSNRPTMEEASLLDTSGWSARTRGVARYLKTVFDTESGRGREVLPINKLLTGKTRTEASRMFFETLVLKTRDYIHVEQEKPFDVINVKPKGKLVKSNF